MEPTLNRVIHHIGNGAQILCFVKDPSPELVRAQQLLAEALALVTKENNNVPIPKEIYDTHGN